MKQLKNIAIKSINKEKKKASHERVKLNTQNSAKQQEENAKTTKFKATTIEKYYKRCRKE